MSNWTVLVVLLLVWGCSGKDSSSTAEQDQFTCPMHPTVISDKQGTCPVCGMELVRKARAGEEVKITEDLAKLLQSPDESVMASITTIKAQYKRMPMTAEAHGVVAYDTRYVHAVPARIAGRLERVYLRYAFQTVSKGQRVAEIYSPELLTAQRELLFLVEHDAANTDLIAAAKEKLVLLGATQKQVDDLIKTKETSGRFTIYSPYDGYLILAGQSMPVAVVRPTSSPGMGGGMGSAVTTPAATEQSAPATSSLVREGDYVSRGQTLFTIASQEALLLELNVPSVSAGSLHIGDSLVISISKEMTIVSVVNFVQPFFADGEEFQKVRVYVRRADLRIGQLVDAAIKRTSAAALWLPNEAIMDMGSGKIVFVKERSVFKPKPITAGMRSDGWTEIRQGIASSDEVAAKAAYLVDSESFIKSK